MASSVVVVISGSVRIDTGEGTRHQALSHSEEYEEYQVSEQTHNDGRKGRKCLDTHSQKLCHFPLFRVHGQINSGADTDGYGYQQGDKYEIDRVEQLVSDASFSREAEHLRLCPHETADDDLARKTDQKSEEEDRNQVENDCHNTVHIA